MGKLYSYLVSLLAVAIALAAALAVLLQSRSKPAPPTLAPRLPPKPKPERHASARAVTVNDHGASAHLEKGGSSPDAVLRCTIQTGGPNPDFLDGMVGSYRDGKFLRFLMQNDESDDPRGYWHSWEVPWSEIVEIISRERTTPIVGTNIKQPDGTYARKGPYLQTRIYKVSRGIECRLLAPDGDDLKTDEHYRWLKASIRDSGVRFSKDTQENCQYGDDGQDALDGYALHLKSRAERDTDEAASERALSLSASEIAALMAARPQRVQTYFKSQKFTDALARRLSNVRERQRTIEQAHVDYVHRIVELAFAGVLPRSYSEIFFYINFRTSGYPASTEVKADLVGVVRLMLQELPYFEQATD